MKIRSQIGCFALAVLVLSMVSSCATSPPKTGSEANQDKAEAQQLVDRCLFTLQNFMADPNMGAMRDYLKRAKGVFITPQLLRGAFIVGASGGSGVFLQRDGDNRCDRARILYRRRGKLRTAGRG